MAYLPRRRGVSSISRSCNSVGRPDREQPSPCYSLNLWRNNPSMRRRHAHGAIDALTESDVSMDSHCRLGSLLPESSSNLDRFGGLKSNPQNFKDHV